jgi:hypothetical protein
MSECFMVASEVRTKEFQTDFRGTLSNGLNALFVVVCTAVGKVVSIYYGDDGMSEIHGGNSLSEMLRFFCVKGWRAFDGAYGAKAAPSGAFLSSDHEGRIT